VFDTLRDATLCEAHEVRVVALVDPAQLLLREAENAYAWRRVRELEATLLDEHSRLAQEEG
jgi:hypothetical protein